MSGWLLDTNIVSAFAPRRPPLEQKIVKWFEDRSDDLFLSTISLVELATGIARLRRTGATERAEGLQTWLDRIVDEYADRMLPLDIPAARIAGALGDAARALGRDPGFADVALAAIAQSRGLTLLTANERHFLPLGVETLNPFEIRT